MLVPKKEGGNDLKDFVIDSVLRKNKCWVLCKLHIEKAYDHVNWEFLLSVLDAMGFGQKWISWIG